MVTLDRLGWNARLTEECEDATPARVAAEHRGRYEIWGIGESALFADLGGRLRHAARAREELPVVGDWVAVRAGGGRAIVDRVLTRRSLLVRKAAGRASDRQPLAANVDRVLIVTTPDRDFSPRRVERYLTVAWDGGAEPIIVLGKIDLVDGAAGFVAALQAVAPGVTVLAVSAHDGRGLPDLAALAPPGSTLALLGSSGVGKSTLVNALAEAHVQTTSPIRAGDDKGRHTTTGRQMVLLPTGALVVDTPGMRELGLGGDETGLDSAFADIQSLAASCRFRDCRHDTEPGCAVRDAIDADRLRSFQSLDAEQSHTAARTRSRRIARELRLRARHDPKLRDP